MVSVVIKVQREKIGGGSGHVWAESLVEEVRLLERTAAIFLLVVALHADLDFSLAINVRCAEVLLGELLIDYGRCP